MCVESFAQKEAKQINSFNFMAKPDSILKKNQNGYIYFTTDTNSKLYDWIVPNPNNEYVTSAYSYYIDYIKKNYKQNLVINNIKDFPRKWNTVHIYKNKYFLYAPSDWMNNSGYYISDSVIYITKSDPDDLYFILSFNSKDHDSGYFKVRNYFGEVQSIQMQLVDKNYGIYVWTFYDRENKIINKHLMQDSDQSKKLPMIVCDCGDSKCVMEFEFDKPEFDKLNKK